MTITLQRTVITIPFLNKQNDLKIVVYVYYVMYLYKASGLYSLNNTFIYMLWYKWLLHVNDKILHHRGRAIKRIVGANRKHSVR